MKVSAAGDFEVAFLEELKQEISSTAIAVFCSNKDIYVVSTCPPAVSNYMVDFESPIGRTNPDNQATPAPGFSTPFS